MIKSKSIILLKSFSQGELAEFLEFLESPYFNKNSRVTKLFRELKKYYPEFESRGVKKEALYNKMFPGKAYNEQVMKNLISELLKLEKLFISIQSFRSNKFRFSLETLSGLTARHAEPLIWKELENLKNFLADKETVTALQNLYSHLMEENLFSYFIISNNQQEASEIIERSGEQLTIYFLKTILRLSINNHINRFSFNMDINHNYPDMILSAVDIPKYLEYPELKNSKEAAHLKLFYFALQSVKDTNDELSYKNYHMLLFENISELTTGDKQLYLHFMESLCAQKINAGKTEYYRDLHETFVYEINNNLYGSDLNKMTILKFRNIILCAIRCGEYDWAEKFINDFKGKLDKDNRKNIVELALAQLNFEKGDYNATLDHLKKIKTDQVFFKVDVRNLNLMTLYELGYYENAISLIESFKKLLYNNIQFTEQYSSKNLNFINSVNTLIKIALDKDMSEANLLLEKINGFSVLSNKKWLLKKIEEIKLK